MIYALPADPLMLCADGWESTWIICLTFYPRAAHQKTVVSSCQLLLHKACPESKAVSLSEGLVNMADTRLYLELTNIPLDIFQWKLNFFNSTCSYCFLM